MDHFLFQTSSNRSQGIKHKYKWKIFKSIGLSAQEKKLKIGI